MRHSGAISSVNCLSKTARTGEPGEGEEEKLMPVPLHMLREHHMVVASIERAKELRSTAVCVALKKFSSLTSDTCPARHHAPAVLFLHRKQSKRKGKKAATQPQPPTLSPPSFPHSLGAMQCSCQLRTLFLTHLVPFSLSLSLFYIRSRHDEAELCDCFWFWLRAVPPPLYPCQPHCLLSSAHRQVQRPAPAPRPSF
jgi:hypothetical protein